MKKNLQIKNSTAEFLIFTASTGQETIDVRYQDENLWVSQKMMALLFDVTIANINIHIKQLGESGEIQLESVIKDFLITAKDGKIYKTKHYNLETVISVGFRTNSTKAIHFRQRAQSVLKQYSIKGYALDKPRLENGTFLGEQFFEELLADIREIRASERKFYQKITDIYATSIDYDPNSTITKDFFATVQNKLHFAIHGNTAAEVIVNRADADKPHMGLTSWKNAPDGKIIKTDVSIAKNYLTQQELQNLRRYVTMYIDFAEDQATLKIPMTMKDWADKLGVFLTMTGRDILTNPGKVSATIAKSFAETEFEKFRIKQDQEYLSDFDKLIKLSID